ncbi:DMT family transporter [Peptococcaceae bacterium 1198_IL3148]
MQGSVKIILAMVIWGSLGVFVRHIDLPSMEIVFLRTVIASVVLGIAWLWFREPESKKNISNNRRLLFFSGIALGLNWVLLFQAYRFTTIANSTLSYYMSPVIVVLLAPVFLKEKLTATKLMAVAGAMVGLSIILGYQPQLANVSFNHGVGIGYGLLAATFYAGVVLLNKQFKNISGFDVTFVQIFVAACFLLPFIIYRAELHVQASDWLWILILGVVHTSIACLLYFSGIKEIKAQNVAVLSYLDPISAIIFSTIFLHEPLTIYAITGGLLILGSTFIGSKETS